MASADESQRLRRAREILARHARRLMRRRGVTGVDVGFRTQRDRVTREITIRIHVERKRPLRELSANQVFPAQIEGMPVDVVERNYRPCAAVVEERRYRDPLQGGAAIASVDQPETWGTLGLVVLQAPPLENSRETLRWYLTAGHIIPDEGGLVRQPPFDPLQWPPGADPIVARLVARRSNLFLDASLLEPVGQRRSRRGVLGMPGPLVAGLLSDEDQLRETRVVKRGAKSGPTRGIVESVAARIDMPGHGTFVDQILIRPVDADELTPFAEPGDSGAVLIQPEGKEVVGLIHGMTLEGHGVACHFSRVVDAFQIST